MLSSGRTFIRSVALALVQWAGLTFISFVLMRDARMPHALTSLGNIGSIGLFLVAGGTVGAVAGSLQSWGSREIALGFLAGVLAWALGGLVLDTPVLLNWNDGILLWSIPVLPEHWEGLRFSRLAPVAGALAGAIQGSLQVRRDRGGTGLKHWVAHSAVATAVAWALVPMGFVHGG
jgi:hypothetical protein